MLPSVAEPHDGNNPTTRKADPADGRDQPGAFIRWWFGSTDAPSSVYVEPEDHSQAVLRPKSTASYAALTLKQLPTVPVRLAPSSRLDLYPTAVRARLVGMVAELRDNTLEAHAFGR